MNARSRTLAILLCLTALLLSVPACGRQPFAPRASGGGPESSSLPPESMMARIAAPDTIEGEIAGAPYVIVVPENWNGDLVLYAHGYTAPIYPVGLPPGEEVLLAGLQGLALQNGLAFAYSLYSETGFGFRDAAQRTDQLRNVFRTRVGPARRTFLIGTSFGGLVAVKLAESRSSTLAGVLTLCGMTGGLRAQIQYVGHVRALFDYFYGEHILPGNVCEGMDPLDLAGVNAVASAARDSILAHPERAFLIAQVDQAPIAYSTPEELVAALVNALVLHAVAAGDLLDRTHGQCFFDNSTTVYTGSLPAEVLAGINQGITRYTARPGADAFLDRSYEPTGDLQVPVITMHTTRDPVVPVFHQQIYHDRVAAQGRLELLHEITVARFGHLAFEPAELGSAFQQLLALAGPPGGALAGR